MGLNASYFRLPPPTGWDLRCAELLHRVSLCEFRDDMSVPNSGSNIPYFLTLEDWTDMFSRNVAKQIKTYAALNYTGSNTSPEWIIWLVSCTLLWYTHKLKPYLFEIFWNNLLGNARARARVCVSELTNKTYSDKGIRCSPWAFIALEQDNQVLCSNFHGICKIN